MNSDRHICKAAYLDFSQAPDFLLVFSRKFHFRATIKDEMKKQSNCMSMKFHVIIHILIISFFCGLCVHLCRVSMRHIWLGSLDFFWSHDYVKLQHPFRKVLLALMVLRWIWNYAWRVLDAEKYECVWRVLRSKFYEIWTILLHFDGVQFHRSQLLTRFLIRLELY